MTPVIEMALLIPLLPLIAYVVQAFFGKRLPRMGDWVSLGAIFGSFLLATAIFAQMWSNFDPHWQHSWHTTWLDIGSEKFPFKLEIGVRIDNLSHQPLMDRSTTDSAFANVRRVWSGSSIPQRVLPVTRPF
jgi:NADH-quinone oxidoreductase subunit L